MYPVRTSQFRYIIPLYTIHKCTDECKYSLYIDSTTIGTIQNPLFRNGKCESFHRAIQQPFLLSSIYKRNYLHGQHVVISDHEYKIRINYPAGTPASFAISNKTPTTLDHLLDIIYNLYRIVYDIEEKTADKETYQITKRCVCSAPDYIKESIVNKNNHESQDNQGVQDTLEIQSIQEVQEDNKEPCSICYVDMCEKDITTLDCLHNYHTECIATWITKGNSNKCPLCRKDIYQCNLCNNTKIISETIECVVIPRMYRRNKKRNTTNGKFKIHDYDMEDLYISYLCYDKISKSVHMDVRSLI